MCVTGAMAKKNHDNCAERMWCATVNEFLYCTQRRNDRRIQLDLDALLGVIGKKIGSAGPNWRRTSVDRSRFEEDDGIVVVEGARNTEGLGCHLMNSGNTAKQNTTTSGGLRL